VLDLRPELGQHDSYTLVLRWRWLGAQALRCKLVECRLQFPPELESAVKVDQGRRLQQDGAEMIIWRNLRFQGAELALSVTFARAILDAPLVLKGAYQIAIDGPVSGISLHPDRIWNARGRRATERTQPSIRAASTITGSLKIDTSLLSQEHE